MVLSTYSGASPEVKADSEFLVDFQSMFKILNHLSLYRNLNK